MIGIAVLASAGAARAEGKHKQRNQLRVAPATAEELVGGGPPSQPLTVAKAATPLVARSMAATVAANSVDLKTLVIAADGNEADLPAIKQALDYLGAPYEVWVAAKKPGQLTAAVLAGGTRGHYNGVIVTDASLGMWNGTAWASALSTTEWDALHRYEATFGVRHLNWYAFPTADLGFTGNPTATDTTATPLDYSVTDAGAPLFPYLAGTASIKNAYVYLAQAAPDAQAVLLTNDGFALAVHKTYADTRDVITLTFDSAPWLLHSMTLAHGLVSWVTHGVFLGQRKVFLSAQIDDFFIEDDIFNGTTYRLTAADMQGVDAWQKAWAASSVLKGFKLDLYFNGAGTVAGAYDNDTLTPYMKSVQRDFKWGNHTFTHQNLDATTYAETMSELTQNLSVANKLGFTYFSKKNLVTPDVSGLTNAPALKAAWDAGVRYCVSDTSKPGQNAGPNTGIYSPLQPGLLEVTRYPTNLYYNVSTPEEWMAEYNGFYRTYWGRDLAYEEILDKESDVLLTYLLRGDMNPLMFHQTNLRIYDGAHSLLGDLVDLTMDKYQSYYNLRIASPTMDALAPKYAQRMAASAAGVTASMSGNNLTLRSAKSTTVAVTGLCNGLNREVYGGQCISQVVLPANVNITLPLGTAAGAARP